MIPELSASDVLKIAGIYATTTLLTLLWLFRSGQTQLPKTFRTTFAITIRNAIAHAGVVWFFCGVVELTLDRLLMWSPLALVLFALSFPRIAEVIGSGVGGMGDLPDIVVVAFVATCFVMFVLPVYLLRQFVLGFVGIRQFLRDRDALKSLADDLPAESPFKPVIQNAISPGTEGVVLAALKPIGKVKIDEVEYNARHNLGAFVDSGTNVLVTRTENGLLIVGEAEDSMS